MTNQRIHFDDVNLHAVEVESRRYVVLTYNADGETELVPYVVTRRCCGDCKLVGEHLLTHDVWHANTQHLVCSRPSMFEALYSIGERLALAPLL